MRTLTRLAVLTAAALLVASPADAGKKKKDKGGIAVTPASMSVSPPANVFLRNSPDTDPSSYIGRFLSDGQAALDESNSHKTQCSTFVSWSKVGGGGFTRDELFQVSDQAAATFGFPPIVGASGSGSQTKMARIKYTLTGKMVSDIADPAAFEACCKQAPDQCTERYVGEFLEGTAGEIFYAVGSAADFEASGAGQGLVGSVEVKHGMAWQSASTWEAPVYFAFKATNTGFVGGGVVAAAGCGDWVNSPPRSSQGMYFVGVSEYLDSEGKAREAALVDARKQTVKWLGESITTGSTEVSGYSGSVGDLSVKLKSGQFLETAAAGVASMVKDENWCLDQQATPRGTTVQAKVLAFLPKSQYTAAVEALAGTPPGEADHGRPEGE